MGKYIYGAGKYGKILFAFFSKVNFDVDGFVQTKITEEKMVFDKPVWQIDNLPKNENNVFFLAIKDNNTIKVIKDIIAKEYPESQITNCACFIEENLLAQDSIHKEGNNQEIAAELFDESIHEENNFRSIRDMDNIIRKNISLIPNDIDLVVGIPRSGMLPATIIALLLNKPLVDINVLSCEKNYINNDMSERISSYSYDILSYKKVLVVDDSCNTGTSIDKAKTKLKKYQDNLELIYCCIYATDVSRNYVDIYFETVNLPRIFEWNILNHTILERACLDLDGVLCVDPSNEENDDGEKYIDFILNAKPLFVPKVKIGFIVTSRLEKYRKETEIWLKANGIRYGHLFMLDLKTKEERIKNKAHSKYKSQIYSNVNAKLFIESDTKQAQEIANKTNKDVYCIENNQYYHRDLSLIEYLEFKEAAKKFEYDILNSRESNEHVTDVIYNLYRYIDRWFNDHNYCIDDIDLKKNVGYIQEFTNAEDFFSEARKLEMKVAIRHLCSSCLRIISNRVTPKAWNAEMQNVYAEITDYIEKSYDRSFSQEWKYIKKKGELQLYPYEFTEKYDESKVRILWDSARNLPFVYHNEMPLYFPCWNEEKIKHNYNQLVMEQDDNSPHLYFSRNVAFEEGSIFVDIGSAEGIISLDVVKKAKKIYIVECSEDWTDALNATFSPYLDKICFVRKYVGYLSDEKTISIDDLLKEYKDENIFLKMDVEGMELEVLGGARNTLNNNNCKVSCATYHYDDLYDEVNELLSAYGYETEGSDGYMLFYFGYLCMQNGGYEHIKKPYFRKAIIRARKET